MRRRIIVFCTLAVLAAALFIRLGFWQVSRLHERQRFNAMVMSQKQAASLPFASVPRDTGAAHYRAASVTGTFDYDHELVWSPRTRQGSPGVDLLTPMHVAGSDTAVLVNRGWVYSPDATRVDLSRWREADTATVTGFVELFGRDSAANSPSDRRLVRIMNFGAVQSRLPFPIAPYYLVATNDTANLAHPARRELPPLDEGPHRGYAFQWFAFALIALGGAVIVTRLEMTKQMSR
jgi:surfeit locus 1 family protein